MGDVEVSIDQGEDMKVVLPKNLRCLRVNDLQRHLVAAWPNCSGGKRRLDDASFILILKAFFLFCISLAFTAPIYGLFISIFPSHQIWRDLVFDLMLSYIVFLGVFTAIFVISVLVRMKSRPSSQERKVEVTIISGDIQNLRLNDELDIQS